MIKQLKILNFQSHAETSINFHKGVNVIVGRSDSGKSAIIRALRWLIWNRPSGSAFRSYWGGITHVLLQTEEGIVQRIKDKADSYELQRRGESNIVFKAFGTDVPEEINTFLNINEINLQYQLDSPFLLSSTSGEVAQHFNRVARLDKIDQGLSNVNSAIRKLGTDIAYGEASEKILQDNLKQFEHIEKFEIEIEVLEEMENQLRGLKSALDNLQLKLYDYSQNEIFMEDYKVLISDESKVNDVLSLYDKKYELVKTMINLQNLDAELTQNNNRLKDEEAVLGYEQQVNQLLDLYQDKKALVDGFTALNKALVRLNDIKISIRDKNQKYDSLLKRWPVGTTCPICGNKL
jgi:DNA repair protein SbcC/Rad50